MKKLNEYKNTTGKLEVIQSPTCPGPGWTRIDYEDIAILEDLIKQAPIINEKIKIAAAECKQVLRDEGYTDEEIDKIFRGEYFKDEYQKA